MDVKEQKAEKRIVYSISELRKNCVTLFDATTSTFDGAMYGADGMASVAEVKEKIQTWRRERL